MYVWFVWVWCLYRLFCSWCCLLLGAFDDSHWWLTVAHGFHSCIRLPPHLLWTHSRRVMRTDTWLALPFKCTSDRYGFVWSKPVVLTTVWRLTAHSALLLTMEKRHFHPTYAEFAACCGMMRMGTVEHTITAFCQFFYLAQWLAVGGSLLGRGMAGVVIEHIWRMHHAKPRHSGLLVLTLAGACWGCAIWYSHATSSGDIVSCVHSVNVSHVWSKAVFWYIFWFCLLLFVVDCRVLGLHCLFHYKYLYRKSRSGTKVQLYNKSTYLVCKQWSHHCFPGTKKISCACWVCFILCL